MEENPQMTADVAVIQKALPTLQNLPLVLSQHQASISRALQVADALKAKCEAAEKMTPELDEECMNMIVKINKTVEKLEGNRKPGTQIMAEIAKMFTGEENKLKAPVLALQVFRNRRAKEVVEENARLDALAKEKAAKDKEKADAIAHYTKAIAGCLNKKLYDRKLELTAGFDSLSLEDIDVRGEKLACIMNAFPGHKLDTILIYQGFAPIYRLSVDEVKQIDADVRNGYDFDTFYAIYQQELDELRNSLVDRLPSKKVELLEKKASAERAEQLRRDQEQQRQRQAQLDKDAAAAKTQAEQQRIAKQQEQEKQRQADLEKQRQEQAEQQRILNQQEEDRKREQANQLQEQNEQKAADAEKTADLAHAGAVGNTLFDVANIGNQKQVEGETRKGWKITVTHMAGWAELFQFWYMGKAASTLLDKFGKMTLDQIKGYAEDQGDKEKIQSKYLTYEETITAVNRKPKASTKPVV